MFGKKKDTENVTPDKPIDKLTDAFKNSNANVPSLRDILSSSCKDYTSTATSTDYDAYSASAYHSIATADRDLQLKIYDILRDIHAKVAGRMNYVNAIKRIADALDSFECPVSECKACKHYTPGRVDGCDKHAAIAEFLVAHRIVEVPLDNSETV